MVSFIAQMIGAGIVLELVASGIGGLFRMLDEIVGGMVGRGR